MEKPGRVDQTQKQPKASFENLNTDLFELNSVFNPIAKDAFLIKLKKKHKQHLAISSCLEREVFLLSG